MSEFERTLQTYIEKVLHLQKEKNEEALSLKDLNKVAEELGLSAEDLDYIDQQFEGFLARAKGFMRYQQWQRATEELNQALILKPLHLDALANITEAYFKLWQSKKQKAYQEQAQNYAERCLRLDPEQEMCLYVVSQFAHKPQSIFRRRAAYGRLLVMLTVILTLGGIFYLAYHLLIAPTTISQNEASTLNPKSIPLPSKFQEIPLQVTQSNTEKGFTIWTEQSLVNRNKGQYSLRACLINQKYDIASLEIRLELLGLSGQVLMSQTIFKEEDIPQETLKGDALPLVALIEVGEEARAARLSVRNAKLLPPETPDDYPIKLIWECARPQGVQLELLERHQLIHPEADFFNHKLGFAFKNTGRVSLKTLKAELRWFDIRRQLIHAESIDLLNSRLPNLPTQQVRVWSGNFLVEHKRSDYHSYKVAVTEVFTK